MMRTVTGVLLGFAGGYLVAARRDRVGVFARLRTTTSELEDLTRDELYKRAQAKDLPGRSNMNKDELRDALGDMTEER